MKTEDGTESGKTLWHMWFGNFFKASLIPLGVDVHTGYPVMREPPEADIIIIRKNQGEWTPDQMRNLPDGIRDCGAEHVIIEFKHTESVNEDVFCTALGYRIFYKRHNKLENDRLQAFLISSKTPEKATLDEFGYFSETQPGVWQSSHSLMRHIPLISLNDLPDRPHNAFVKLFATKGKQRIAAMREFREGRVALTESLTAYVRKFLRILEKLKGDGNMEDMDLELSRGEIMEMVQFMRTVLTTEELMEGISPEKRLEGIPPEQRLEGLTMEEIEAYLQKRREKASLC